MGAAATKKKNENASLVEDVEDWRKLVVSCFAVFIIIFQQLFKNIVFCDIFQFNQLMLQYYFQS